MRFSILTLFPEMLAGPLDHSILARGRARGLLDIRLVQIRDFATDRHHRVDDAPFGGGPGMVMKATVLAAALQAVQTDLAGHVVVLSPQGSPFRQADARRLATKNHLVLVCGHYEGLDERFVQTCADEEISLGDFVLTGGEIPALAVVDAVARLVPGVLGDPASHAADSFGDGLLDCPHYTRPRVWRHQEVPAVLLAGDHQAIAQWRRRQSLLTTLLRRPDLLAEAGLDKAERRLLTSLASLLAETAEDVCMRPPS